MLLAHVLGVGRERLLLDRELIVAGAAGARLPGRRAPPRVQREPVAYIIGRRGFRRIELAVDARALIPRPETELLVEVALGAAAPARACSTSARAAARSRSRSSTSARTST